MNAAQMPNLLPLLPELVLGLGSMALLLIGASRPARASEFVVGAGIVLLWWGGLFVAFMSVGRLTAFGGSFIVDEFARFLKILALLGSAAAIVMSLDYAKRQAQ